MIFIVTCADAGVAMADAAGAEAFVAERRVTKFYRERRRAESAAKAMAQKYPGEMFAVFEARSLYEAKQPEIMEKVVSETGEIVPRG